MLFPGKSTPKPTKKKRLTASQVLADILDSPDVPARGMGSSSEKSKGKEISPMVTPKATPQDHPKKSKGKGSFSLQTISKITSGQHPKRKKHQRNVVSTFLQV